MKILFAAFLVACLFPYTQFLPIQSYTQPYALILGLVIFAIHGRATLESIPRFDSLTLIGLAFAGTIAFIIDCIPSPSSQEAKYLLIYLTPLVLTIAGFTVIHQDPILARRIVSASAIIWLTVGSIQSTVNPNFMVSLVGQWQESVEDVIASGRGVLGLAPEPTHFGFHLVVMAGLLTLLAGNRLLTWSCILGALIFARSSSAALALLMGAGLFTLQMPPRFKVPILLALGLTPLFILWLIQIMDPESSRLLFLMSSAIDNPSLILQLDYSVNVRLGGMIAPLLDTLDRGLLPHGLSHAYWLEHSRLIIENHAWLLDLSQVGPASGYGIVIYQLGFVGALLLARPISRLVAVSLQSFDKIAVLAAASVFVGQYFISTPSFSLLYASSIWVTVRYVSAEARSRRRYEAPTSHTQEQP